MKEISTVDFTGFDLYTAPGKYFYFYGQGGLVYFWFQIDSNGDDPALAGRGILLDMPENPAPSNVPGWVASAIDTDADFSASYFGNIVTITDNLDGERIDINAGTSGLIVAVSQQGSSIARLLKRFGARPKLKGFCL